MRFLTAAILAATLSFTPAYADEFSEAIALAVEAYEAGDFDDAEDELSYALEIVQANLTTEFARYLPEPLDGWTMELQSEEVIALIGMFGGGIAAKGHYTNGTDVIDIQIMAGNNLVASMGAMFGNAATMAMMGEVVRIKREKFVFTDGDTQGLIGNVLFQISGGGSREDVIALLENADFKAIEDY